jgi:hypothetical protein
VAVARTHAIAHSDTTSTHHRVVDVIDGRRCFGLGLLDPHFAERNDDRWGDRRVRFRPC